MLQIRGAVSNRPAGADMRKPKMDSNGDGRGVKEPYVKPDDYCSFGEKISREATP